MHPKLRELIKVLQRATELESRLLDHEIRFNGGSKLERDLEQDDTYGEHVHLVQPIVGPSWEANLQMSVCIYDSRDASLGESEHDVSLHFVHTDTLSDGERGPWVEITLELTHEESRISIDGARGDVEHLGLIKDYFRQHKLTCWGEDRFISEVEVWRTVDFIADVYKALAKLAISS